MYLSLTEWKVFALFTIGIGNFIIGVIPAYLIDRNNNEKKKIFVSGLLCFGIGALLADAPFFEAHWMDIQYFITAASGFFSLYLANEIYNYRQKFFSSNETGHIYSAPARSTTHMPLHEIIPENPELVSNVLNAPSSSFTREERVHQYNDLSAAPRQPRHEEESFLGHKTPLKSNSNSYVSHFGLALALIVDAGNSASVIGYMPKINSSSMSQIFLCQFVSALWFGFELSGAYGCGAIHIFAILLYAGASSLGVGIGMLIHHVQVEVADGLFHFTKAMILYVILIEILPREKTRWHNSPMQYAELIQFSSALCGYIFMTVTSNYEEFSRD